MRYALIVLLVAACRTVPEPRYLWTHDTGARDRVMLDRDFGYCEAQALANPFMTTERGMQIFMACMAGRGWRLVQI